MKSLIKYTLRATHGRFDFEQHLEDVADSIKKELKSFFRNGGEMVFPLPLMFMNYAGYETIVITKIYETPEKDVAIRYYANGDELDRGTYTLDQIEVNGLAKIYEEVMNRHAQLDKEDNS